jgi:hypothetical protein
MKRILAILKRHVFNIVCGAVALAAIGLGVLGLGAMGDVRKELDEVKSLHGRFAGPTRTPVNNKSIEAERVRVETLKGYHKELMERARSLNHYEPLTPPEGESFYPVATRDGKLGFRDIYSAAFDAMLVELKSGEPPTENEIQQMQDEMDDERRARESIIDDDVHDSESEGMSHHKMADEPHPSGLITDAAARESAEARASIRKARSIYCYADRSAFDVNKRVFENFTPSIVEMWKAQVSLWVQQDVVASLARMNREAAERIKAKGGKPWVGVLPIKDLISIRVSGYTSGSETRESVNSDPVGRSPAYPPGDGGVVFTKTTSTDMYDAVQFSVKMVVDARQIPRIIEEISRDRFHTLLRVAYAYDRNELENLSMEGRIYGSQPTVTVVFDFETMFFGDVYRCMMPDAMLAEIGKTCPDRAKGAS